MQTLCSLEFLKQLLYLCICLSEAAIQEYFQNKVVPKSNNLDAFLNIAALHL